MSNRAKVITIIVVGLLVIAGIIYFFVRSEMEQKGVKMIDENAPVPQAENTLGQEPAIKVAPPTKEEKQASSVKAVAQTFAERFGSYSNHAKYKNFDELYSMMTAGMEDWVKNTYIPQLNNEHSSEGFYYQITTEAPVVNIVAQTETAVKVLLSTQRREQSGEQSSEFLQDLELTLVKQGNNWFVDAAFWQERE